MRFLLVSTGLGAIAAVMTTPAAAETTVSTAVTTPLKTSTSSDIRITSTGSVKPSSGAAVTIDSNNYVINSGAIAIQGSNNAVGILANPNLSGDIVNFGSITIDENYTPTDSDNDGDLDGPFAQGSGRFGIHVLSGGNYFGSIINSGTITVEGNGSAGIAIDSHLTSYINESGVIKVTGDNSFGIRTTSVANSVTISNGSISTQGANSIGVLLGGDIGGAVVIQGAVSSTGYRFTAAPADPSKLDADDLLQGGSAVVVAGSVAGGVLFDVKPTASTTNPDADGDGVADSAEGSSVITSFGAAPAVVIGSASQDVTLGTVAGSAFGHGLVNKGTITGDGVYSGIAATGVAIGGLGKLVNVTGGMTNNGTVTAKASGANATGIHVGAGSTVPQIVNTGTISAIGGGSDSSVASAILIDSGATVSQVFNAGAIVAQRNGDSGSAGAIVDNSGTLSLVQNSGTIGVDEAASLGDSATAIDLHLNTAGATVRQIAPSSGTAVPLIQGNVRLGTGNDTVDLQAGNLFGNVDFGGGTDTLSLTGTSVLRGNLLHTDGLAVSIGTGSTLDANNLGPINLASLTAADGSKLGVTIGKEGFTSYNVAGAATFGTGSQVLVTLDSVGSAAGTYTIVDAGTLTGGANLTDTIVTLPFLFDSHLTADDATGQVVLDVAVKDSGELQLNRSEAAIIDAALDAADLDRGFAATFLSTDNAADLKHTLQQLMPEHAGGVFETATKGSRLAAGVLADPKPLGGLWMQQVAWGSTKSIGDTSRYDLEGWGATMGFDHSLGPLGRIGLTAAYLYGKDGKDANELISNHYEGGVYWRTSAGPFSAWARATAATINFSSTRNFSSTTNLGPVTRAADAKWSAKLYSATGGLSYEARMGRLTIRPNARAEYYKLDEKGYAETGGGDGFDLTVLGRKSKESAASGMLTLGYDLMGIEPDSTWMRVEVEAGWRQVLSGSIGHTTASFKDGDPFTLYPEKRKSGWNGAARLLAGGSTMSVVGEVDAEEQRDKASLGARLGVNFAL
ncbi:MAG TPA: autotransporter domain-containing protein [Sphingomicrobium sp.]|nr:autotransporter domain-containing protein [Sphingomicrobium sp.]